MTYSVLPPSSRRTDPSLYLTSEKKKEDTPSNCIRMISDSVPLKDCKGFTERYAFNALFGKPEP